MGSEKRVILVLGFALNADGAPTLELRERIRVGIAASSKRDVLMFSGGKAGNYEKSEAQVMKAIALESRSGDGMARIMLEEESHTTIENFVFSRVLMQKTCPDVSSVVVVTSSFHLKRCIAIAHVVLQDYKLAFVGSENKLPLNDLNTYKAREPALLSSLYTDLESYNHLMPESCKAFVSSAVTTVPNKKMKKKVLFIRHAHSEHNINNAQPKVDPLLTERGLKQVEKLRTKLQPALETGQFQVLITSPLSRTIQTAIGLLGDTNIPILVEPLATEHCKTMFDEGRSSRLLAQDFPKLNFTYLPGTWGQTRAPESTESFVKRIVAFWHFLYKIPQQSIIVVGHHNFYKALLGISLSNCGYTEIELQGITYDHTGSVGPNRKFHHDGSFKWFPGNTVVSFVPRSSPQFALLQKVQLMLWNSKLAEYYAFLPSSSFHVTLCSLVSQGNNPLPGMNWADIHSEIERKTREILHSSRSMIFSVKFKEISNRMGINLLPCDPSIQRAMQELKDKLTRAVATVENKPQRDHRSGGRGPPERAVKLSLHVSLAYPIRELPPSLERESVDLMQQMTKELSNHFGALELSKPTFTVFNDMSEYRAIGPRCNVGLCCLYGREEGSLTVIRIADGGTSIEMKDVQVQSKWDVITPFQLVKQPYYLLYNSITGQMQVISVLSSFHHITTATYQISKEFTLAVAFTAGDKTLIMMYKKENGTISLIQLEEAKQGNHHTKISQIPINIDMDNKIHSGLSHIVPINPNVSKLTNLNTFRCVAYNACGQLDLISINIDPPVIRINTIVTVSTPPQSLSNFSSIVIDDEPMVIAYGRLANSITVYKVSEERLIARRLAFKMEDNTDDCLVTSTTVDGKPLVIFYNQKSPLLKVCLVDHDQMKTVFEASHLKPATHLWAMDMSFHCNT